MPFYGKDYTCEHGEPYGQCPRGCENPARPLVRVDLESLAMRGVPPPEFAVDDFLYRGAVHSVSGPPDSGKTTLLAWWTAQLLRDGQPVMLLDEESGPEVAVEKLLAVGAAPVDLRQLWYYPFPSRRWDHLDLDALREQIEAARPVLLVADSMSALLAAAGSDEDKAADVRRFVQRVLLEPARQYRHAVVYTDHTRKDGNGGRYARGSGDKLAVVDVAYTVNPVTVFHRGQDGLLRLTATKDRRGYLHRDHDVHVLVDAGRIRLDITESDSVHDGLSPAARKVLDVLTAAGRPLSIRDIGDAVRAKFGHGLTRPTISKTCAALAQDGLVDEISTGPRGTKYFEATTP